MELKQKETNEERLIRLVGILLARVTELDSKVDMLMEEREDMEAGVYYEGNDDYKAHIFQGKGDKE